MNLDSLIKTITGKVTLPRQSMHMRDWQSWYKGNVRNFHNYRLYNGENFVNCEMKSMQMAKFLCETWADLLFNEKCDIVLPEANNDKFHKILRDNNFWVIANQGVEKSFALGMGALVLNINGLEQGDKGTIKKDNARLGIQFIDGGKVRPITVENGIITECAFESQNSDNTTFVIHVKDETGKYVIYSHKYNKENVLVASMKFPTNSETQYFQILRPNSVNNLNDDLVNDELAISVFANTVDGLKDLDAKYDSFYNEGILGRRRIFLDKKAYQVDIESGEKIKSFDPFTTQNYFVNTGEDGKPIIQSEAAALRFDQQILGINAQLNYVGLKTGFGPSFFKFDGTGIMTATQVISDNSAMFRRVRKHELVLTNALYNLTKVIIQASNDFTADGIGIVKDEDIAIMFDDSIIEDTGAEKDRDKSDVTAGLMSREEYRVKWYGEDIDTAIANVRKYFLYEKIGQYQEALTEGAMTPELFVNEVYGDIDNKQETIDYIKKFLSQGDFEDFVDMNRNNEDDITHEEDIA